MSKLGAAKNMAITEPLRYGKLIAALPGLPPVRQAIVQYTAASQPLPVRLTALGFYLDQGTPAELPLVSALSADKTPVPECAKGAEGCEWQCEITVGTDQVVKAVQTVGDFVEYCVKPAMTQRSAAPSAEAKN